MKVHPLPSSPLVAPRTRLLLTVAAAACVHAGGVSAQSVTLVMEEARVQRECAAIKNAGAVPIHQPPEAVSPRCCRAALLTSQEEGGRAIAAAFALVAIAGCIYFCMKAPRRR